MPGELGAEEIYAVARQAGFSPDQAVTMTAIALAESGGNPGAHNPNGEDSRGLWQINMSPSQRHAAVGAGPRPVRPASTTPGRRGRCPGRAPTSGRGRSPTPTGAPATSSTRTRRSPPRAPTARRPTATSRGAGELRLARRAGGSAGRRPVRPCCAGLPPARRRRGDARRRGRRSTASSRWRWPRGRPLRVDVEANPDDPDPDVFDCSELVEWAAAQVGVAGGRGVVPAVPRHEGGRDAHLGRGRAQHARRAAVHVLDGAGARAAARRRPHVAISLGDGRVIEARSPSYGVGVFEAGDRFDYAALIPGMDYAGRRGRSTPRPLPVPTPLPPPEPSPLAIAAMNAGRRRHRPRHAPRPLRDQVPARPEPGRHRRRRHHRRLRADRARHQGRSPTPTSTSSPTTSSWRSVSIRSSPTTPTRTSRWSSPRTSASTPTATASPTGAR